jgi:NAD(P)H-flavin reductase
MIALEMGVSSRLIAYLTPGEPVVVMGPTGTPTEIPHGEAVLLAGGGLGNAVLFSIAKALKDQATGSSTSPATRRARTSTSARRSRRPPTR